MTSEVNPNLQARRSLSHRVEPEKERVVLEVPKGCAEVVSSFEECGSTLCHGITLILQAPLDLMMRIGRIFFPAKERFSNHVAINRCLEKIADSELEFTTRLGYLAAILSVKDRDPTREIERALSWFSPEERSQISALIEASYRRENLPPGEGEGKLRNYLTLSVREQQRVLQAIFLHSENL